ncbi:MAG: SDR family oxidoreductase [Clostridiales bacterium]|jgi:2-deoxy-D-gluconate 3-dehydrogenase|nr:SDR family oxidoreductase [Clostridiales bacterium]OPZ68402.1 MAG: 2-dehydro-3-deoxy-D-gluconate 5-dehydrogenase [Firmicutes bacterium ADurb.Bin467]
MFELTGKKAIVTGATRGMGLAIAEGYLRQGAEVAITGTSDRVFGVAEELSKKTGGICHGVVADFRTREGTASAFDACVETLGGELDILVNNAGIQRNHKAEEFTFESWDDVIRVNLEAVFAFSQRAGRIMLKRGKGRIINMASLLSIFGGRQCTAYAAAKGGVTQMTKAMSNEWGGRGITVNAIAPGYMNTDMNKAFCADLGRSGHLLARIPVGRWGEEDDVVAAAVFFASDEAAYVSGTMLPVDGGFTAW